MLELPSRDALSELRRAIDAVVPTRIVGLTRPIDNARVQMLFWHAYGTGSYNLSIDDVPEVLRPATQGVGHPIAVDSTSPIAIEWRIAFAGATHVVSVPIQNLEPVARLWVGLAGNETVTSEQIQQLTDVGRRAAALLERSSSAADQTSRLQRLELASGLLPALMQVLDIREVLDSLSEISKRALPHDILTLSLLNDDLTRVTLQARATGPRHRQAGDPQYAFSCDWGIA
jgi:hypothetical protein